MRGWDSDCDRSLYDALFVLDPVAVSPTDDPVTGWGDMHANSTSCHKGPGGACRYGPKRRNVMDVYLPAAQAATQGGDGVPVALFCHGGVWAAGGSDCSPACGTLQPAIALQGIHIRRRSPSDGSLPRPVPPSADELITVLLLLCR